MPGDFKISDVQKPVQSNPTRETNASNTSEYRGRVVTRKRSISEGGEPLWKKVYEKEHQRICSAPKIPRVTPRINNSTDVNNNFYSRGASPES